MIACVSLLHIVFHVPLYILLCICIFFPYIYICYVYYLIVPLYCCWCIFSLYSTYCISIIIIFIIQIRTYLSKVRICILRMVVNVSRSPILINVYFFTILLLCILFNSSLKLLLMYIFQYLEMIIYLFL